MITISNLYKSFGAQLVIEALSLDVYDGEMLAIVGPSGAGKSVLLKIIAGLLLADEGSVVVNGIVVKGAFSSKSDANFNFGILFQGAALFDSLTLYENLVFPLEIRGGYTSKYIKSRAANLLSEVGLLGQEHLLPGQVSIGIRKRLGIARALITEPNVILFDEPNTGLDPETGQEIYDLIKQVKKVEGFTGILISHEIPTVFQVCDRVAMLYEGKLEIIGSIAEFMECNNPIVSQFRNGAVIGPMASY